MTVLDDLQKYSGLLTIIIEAISAAAKAAGESDDVVAARVAAYLLETAKDSTDVLAAEIAAKYAKG